VRVILVNPTSHDQRSRCRTPAIGLLKLSTLLKKQGHQVRAVLNIARQIEDVVWADQALVTSTFSWEAEKIGRTIRLLKDTNPALHVRLGGLYPMLAPIHAQTTSGADEICTEVIPEADECIPDYFLSTGDTPKELCGMKCAYVWTTRGCVRDCSFCLVPRIFGRNTKYPLPVAGQVLKWHTMAYVMDDNTLAGPDPVAALLELKATEKWVNFSQGLDARLISLDVAKILKSMRMPFVRIAFDRWKDFSGVARGIANLKKAGHTDIPVSMCLYNYEDTPQEFFQRVQFLVTNRVAACLKRFNPLTTAEKNNFIHEGWRPIDVRAVEGFVYKYGSWGSIRPAQGLMDEFRRAESFADVFRPEEVAIHAKG